MPELSNIRRKYREKIKKISDVVLMSGQDIDCFYYYFEDFGYKSIFKLHYIDTKVFFTCYGNDRIIKIELRDEDHFDELVTANMVIMLLGV